jgi:hypothetical protein
MKKISVKVIDGPLPPGVWESPEMEPDFSTRPQPTDVLSDLMAREPLFHRPEFGTTREDFDRMMAPDFWEVTASGRRVSREFVLNLLPGRYKNPTEEIWEIADFLCQEIAPDNYLITYTLFQNQRVTRRATLWRRTSQGWQIVFHQGTLVSKA